MELPIYDSFSDFEKNFTKDYSNYLFEFPNARELDFLNELKNNYSRNTKIKSGKRIFNNEIWIKSRHIDEFGNIIYNDNEIELWSFCFALNNQYNTWIRGFESSGLSEVVPISEYIEFIIDSGFDEDNLNNTESDFKFIFDNLHHKEYFKFLYYEDCRLLPNKIKYKDYGFFISKVLDFIDSRIKQLENFGSKLPQYENTNVTLDYDYSDTPNLQRMIILEKLGIIDYIKSLQNDPENEKHTAEIISSFTGIHSSTIAKNLGVMLGYKKDDINKNSPYKNPKNLQLANNKLDKFNIDLTKIFK